MAEREEILERIRRHEPGVIDDDRKLHCAVCIPLIPTEAGFDVLFEVRSGKIPAQPGDVCLPGGRMEPGRRRCRRPCARRARSSCWIPAS